MNFKYIFYSILAIIIVGFGYFGYKAYNKKSNSEIINNTTEITKPIETRIIERHYPAVIETLFVSGKPNSIATYKTKIDTTDVSVDLLVKYNIDKSEFDIDSKITSYLKEKVTEKTIYVKQKPKFIGITTGIGIGLGQNEETKTIEPKTASIDAGLKFVGKYSVTGFIDTNKNLGIRLGIDF